jgi:exonuclease III
MAFFVSICEHHRALSVLEPFLALFLLPLVWIGLIGVFLSKCSRCVTKLKFDPMRSVRRRFCDVVAFSCIYKFVFFGRYNYGPLAVIILLICVSGDVHPNPGPVPVNSFQNLTFFSCNINSICSSFKRNALAATLESLGYPDVVALQETKIGSGFLSSELKMNAYQIFRRDRVMGAGGVLIAVKNNIRVNILPRLYRDPTEMLWVELSNLGRGKKIIFGTYYRPRCNDLVSATAFAESVDVARVYAANNQAKLIITGDLNCNDITWRDARDPIRHRGSAVILEAVEQAHLSQLVHEPTRNAAILDLVFCSHPDLVSNLCTVPAFSDHVGVYFVSSFKVAPPQEIPKTRHHWNRANFDRMREMLVLFDEQFQNSYASRSVEENWILMKAAFSRVVEENVPSSSTRPKLKILPREVIRLCRRKQRAYKTLRLYDTPENQARYRALRKASKRAVSRANRDHMEMIARSLATENTRPFWGFIKSLRQDRTDIPLLRLNDGTEITDPVQKARIFNEEFVNVFTAEPRHTYLPDLPPPVYHMNPFTITVDGVRKRLESLNVTKACGPDGVSGRFLCFAAPFISASVTALFNQSLNSAEIPTDWKSAIVHPVYKKGDKSLPLNYRPISLTCVLCKQLEHILVSQINRFLGAHNLLYERQHGFRSGQSCETALASLVHDWASKVDAHFIAVDAIFLDFAKAFDKVPHQRLVHKISHFGIDGNTVNWIKSFLSNRFQRVLVAGSHSQWLPVSSGIPQGSVLGPLLFSLFINDLPFCVSMNTKINLFADDCVVYRQVCGPSDLRNLQRDINEIERWSCNWLLPFNADKCSHMRVSLRRQDDQVIPPPRYMLGQHPMVKVTSVKYLGVVLQSNLRFNEHIDQTVSKSNSLLGLLRRNLSKCSTGAKLTAYKALVRSRLEYCSSIFDPYQLSLTRRLEAIQNRASRFICSDYSRRSHVTFMKVRLKLENLSERRTIARHKLVNSLLEGRVKIPGIVLINRDTVHPPVHSQICRNTIIYRTLREVSLGQAPALPNPP